MPRSIGPSFFTWGPRHGPHTPNARNRPGVAGPVLDPARKGYTPTRPQREGGVSMKLLFFDDFKLGVLNGDQVVDVSEAVKDIPRVGPQDVINGVITGWTTYRGKLEQAAKAGRGVPVNRV